MKPYLKPTGRLDLGPRPPCPKCGTDLPWKNAAQWQCRNHKCFHTWKIKPRAHLPRKPIPGAGLPSFENRPPCPQCGSPSPKSHGKFWECRNPKCNKCWLKEYPSKFRPEDTEIINPFKVVKI